MREGLSADCVAHHSKILFRYKYLDAFWSAGIVPTNPGHVDLTSIATLRQASTLAAPCGCNIAPIL